jgi:hypothetical protein
MKNAQKNTAVKAAKKTAPNKGITVVQGAKQAAKAAKAKTAKQAAKTAPKETNGELAIHINKTGRVCFGKLAAARIGDLSS